MVGVRYWPPSRGSRGISGCVGRVDPGVPAQYYLQYLGAHRFRSRSFDLPEGAYLVEVINTWDLTVVEVLRTDSGHFTVPLPPLLYHAIRATRC